jgi:hypothetical protein
MKQKITFFTFAGKCGTGATGAPSALRPKRPAMATEPNPIEQRRSISLRESAFEARGCFEKCMV